MFLMNKAPDNFSQARLAPLFENHYRCPDCGNRWQDRWDSQCDDECPDCGLRDISPGKSNMLNVEDAQRRSQTAVPAECGTAGFLPAVTNNCPELSSNPSSIHLLMSLDRQGYWSEEFGWVRDVQYATHFIGRPSSALPADLPDARFVTPEEAAFQGDFDED